MVIIEVLVYVYIASMMVVCVNYVNKAGFGKKSDFIHFWIMLCLILTQILIQISPQIRNSIHYITHLCLGTLFTLTLFYIITRITVSSIKTHEDARVWIGGAMFLVLVTSLCALLMGLPDTITDICRMPLAVAMCMGMKYYPPMLDRFARLGDAAEKRTVEKSVEGHKDAVINLAIESWRFAKVFERGIAQLSASRAKRHTSQLRLFLKKTEESLEESGLRIVNVEGHSYDPGMAATPLNIEDFEPDDHLVVDQMLEPIIMEGTVLAKTGTVTLRRVE